MSKPCPKCGALISESASLCQYCGCPIGGNSSDNSTTQPNFVSAPQTTKLERKEHSPKRFFIALLFLITLGCFVYYCGQGNSASDKTSTNEQNELHTADLCTDVVENIDGDEDDTLDSDEKVISEQTEHLPYSGKDVYEYVVEDFGKRTIRTQADESLCFTDLMKNKKNCFILLSKKDYYLYVYEPQNGDTVMLARFDCAFALKKGDKSKQGDMRTPHCVSMSKPFYVSEIKNASSWCHDFGDGRGSIKSYGDYFIRLLLAGHQVEGNNSIGIHGSTNNEESVPGRASEGCIRLKDNDIKILRENFVTEKMMVIIKAEDVDDYDFEIKAMQKQNVKRKRHFNPANILTNEQVDKAKPQQGRSKGDKQLAREKEGEVIGENKTLEELSGQPKEKRQDNSNDKGKKQTSKNKTLNDLHSK